MTKISTDKDCLKVTLTCNALDATNANGFKEQVKSSISHGIQRAELNLAAVEFMDSSGIGAILIRHC